jgi:hypothetical protein
MKYNKHNNLFLSKKLNWFNLKYIYKMNALFKFEKRGKETQKEEFLFFISILIG